MILSWVQPHNGWLVSKVSIEVNSGINSYHQPGCNCNPIVDWDMNWAVNLSSAVDMGAMDMKNKDQGHVMCLLKVTVKYFFLRLNEINRIQTFVIHVSVSTCKMYENIYTHQQKAHICKNNVFLICFRFIERTETCVSNKSFTTAYCFSYNFGTGLAVWSTLNLITDTFMYLGLKVKDMFYFCNALVCWKIYVAIQNEKYRNITRLHN